MWEVLISQDEMEDSLTTQKAIRDPERDARAHGCRILGLQPLIPFLQCVNWLGLRFVL